MAVQFNAFTDRYKPFLPVLALRKYDVPPKSLNGFQFALPMLLQYFDNIDDSFKLKRVSRYCDTRIDSELISRVFPHFANCQRLALHAFAFDRTVSTVKRDLDTYSFSLSWCLALPDVTYFETSLFEHVTYLSKNEWSKSVMEKAAFIGKNDTHLYFLCKGYSVQGPVNRVMPFCCATRQSETLLPLILDDKAPLYNNDAKETIDFIYELIKFRKKCFLDQKNITIISRQYLQFYVVKLLITDKGLCIQHWQEQEDPKVLSAQHRCSSMPLLNWQRFCVIPLENQLYTSQLVLLNDLDNRELTRVPLRTKLDFRQAHVSADDTHMAVQYGLGNRAQQGELANLDVYDHAGKPKIQISDRVLNGIHLVWMSQGFLIYQEHSKDDSIDLIFWSVWLKRYVKTIKLPKEMGITRILGVHLVENQRKLQEVRIPAVTHEKELRWESIEGEMRQVKRPVDFFAVISLTLSQPEPVEKKA